MKIIGNAVLRLSLVYSLLVSGWVGQKCAATPPSTNNDPLSVIHRLEGRRSLETDSILRLAVEHLRMGEFYLSMSRWGSLAIAEAASCYGDTVKHGAGGEFFGALAMLEAGKSEEALTFCEMSSKARLMPKVLKGLTTIIKNFANQPRPEGQVLEWSRFHPASYWDSLEIALQLSKENPQAMKNLPLPRPDSVCGEVTGTPLILRARLQWFLSAKDTAGVKTLLDNLNQFGIPVWQLRHPDGVITRFCDPAIFGVLARAHTWISSCYFEMAGKISSPKNWAPDLAVAFSRTCFRQGDFTTLARLLESLPDSMRLRPYRGWALWKQGQQSKALKLFDEVRRSKHTQAQAQMLVVGEAVPDYTSSLDSLAQSLVAGVSVLGSFKEVAASAQGRDKVYRMYSAAAGWFLFRKDFANACLYYQLSCWNSGVSLQAYPLSYSTGYYFAKLNCGRPDYFQEAYSGFRGLKDYLPSLASFVEPLNVIKFCMDLQE